MSVTAQEVITSARDGHAAFSKARHPNAGLLRALQHYKKQLWSRVTNVNSSVLAVIDTIDIQAFNFATGYAFPANIYVLPDGEVSHPSDPNPSYRGKFTLVGQTVRTYSRPVYSGWFVQNQLFLQGELLDWGQAVNLYIGYVAMPTGPATLAANFDPMPDSVEPVLETFLQKVMAGKGHMDETLPPIDVKEFNNEWHIAEDRFLSEQGEKKKAHRIKTLDVFPGGR